MTSAARPVPLRPRGARPVGRPGFPQGWASSAAVGPTDQAEQRQIRREIAPVRVSSADLRAAIKVDLYDGIRQSSRSREQVAGELGIGVGELRRKMALDDVHCLAADQVPALCQYIDDHRILHRLAEACGHAAVPLPEEGDPKETMSLSLLTLQRAHGLLGEALLGAIGEGSEAGREISSGELEQVHEAGMEVVRRVLCLVECARRQRAGGGEER